MRNLITRSITATTIKSRNVSFKDGELNEVENAGIVINGVVTGEKALKEVRKIYGSTALVTDIVNVDSMYEISVEDFIKYAKKVEVTTAEPVKEETKTE